MAEEETTGVVTCVYDAIFQQALRPILQCLGFSDSTTTSEQAQLLEECSTTTDPLIVLGPAAGSDEHKEELQDGNHKPDTRADSRDSEAPAAGSSSSSSPEDGEEQADPQQPSKDPPTSDPSVLALGRLRMPPRPPVSSGRGGQTN